MDKQYLVIISFLFIFSSCTDMKTTIPTPKKEDKLLKIHGDTRVDPYYWLNNRENPEVISYLEEENKYSQSVLKSTKKFQKELFDEMKGRIKEDDSSVPYLLNGYWYITRYEKGKEYPIYTRKFMSLDSEEEIMLDVNEMAKDYEYYQVSGLSVSPDNKKISFGVDTLSRRIYTINVKNLETGKMLSDEIKGVNSYTAWSSDSKTFFYTGKDEETLRSDRIFRHNIGDDQRDDEIVYEEKDETFSTYVYPSKSREYIFIGSESTLSSEYRYLPSDTPNQEFKVLQERERGLEYRPYHIGDMFYITTNADNSTNFKIVKTPISNTNKSNWEDVIQHSDDILIDDLELFSGFMAIEQRENGLVYLRVIGYDNDMDYFINENSSLDFQNETYSFSLGYNPEFNTENVRLSYNSLTVPSTILEYNTNNKQEKILKQQQVLGNKFNSDNYTSERLFAVAHDGKKIPISIVRHKDTKLNSDTPLLQYGYGSYGITVDPRFSSVRLSLLDRGFVYAIAHIRGSQYLGREWYEDGRVFNKKNTFMDFISASEFLIEKKYTSPDHLYAMGGSAGGLLMGAIMNMSPELYNGVISAVPFVDVVTTMLDESIPLTTGEYDEWGDPNIKEFYDYMLSYSPYDNIKNVEYPNTLVTTGLHDSQVQYWEPAKWVAKLRDYHQGDNKIILHTDMDAGHSGSSGRFEALKEIAMEYAFLFMLEGINQ